MVPEDQVDFIGEIEQFTPGTSASGVFDLEPGNYVLLCNIAEIEEGELESHYELGMRTSFTVTGSSTGTGTMTGTATDTGTGTGTMTATGVAEPGVVEPAPAGAAQVTVDLSEWAVSPDTNTVRAGEVYFLANNIGPDDPHELVIIRTDLAPGALPVNEGVVPEDQVDFIGEIEQFTPGTSASGVFDLEPGNYVLLCNIAEIEEGELESHYELGMRTSFTVR